MTTGEDHSDGMLFQLPSSTSKSSAFKLCPKCGQRKNIEDFDNERSKKDGKRCYCRACIQEYNRSYRNTERGRVANRNLASRWSKFLFSAKRKGHQVSLTKDQFAAISYLPCSYCGGALPEVGCGLDRIIAGGPYNVGNVAPCCIDCNCARNNRLTPEEMMLRIGPAIALTKKDRGEILRIPIPFHFWKAWDGTIETIPQTHGEKGIEACKSFTIRLEGFGIGAVFVFECQWCNKELDRYLRRDLQKEFTLRFDKYIKKHIDENHLRRGVERVPNSP